MPAIDGATQHLLDENIQVLNQISANLSTYKVMLLKFLFYFFTLFIASLVYFNTSLHWQKNTAIIYLCILPLWSSVTVLRYKLFVHATVLAAKEYMATIFVFNSNYTHDDVKSIRLLTGIVLSYKFLSLFNLE